MTEERNIILIESLHYNIQYNDSARLKLGKKNLCRLGFDLRFIRSDVRTKHTSFIFTFKFF
jgi:hypothetical protein